MNSFMHIIVLCLIRSRPCALPSVDPPAVDRVYASIVVEQSGGGSCGGGGEGLAASLSSEDQRALQT